MKYNHPLVPALFQRREKRFSVLARILEGPEEGQEVWSHCPNPGRLTSCLDQPGVPLYLSCVPENPRNPSSYRFRTEQSEPLSGVRVGINPLRANLLAVEAMAAFRRGWRLDGSEVATPGGSRIDHLFTDEAGRRWFVEVKSVTYREGEAALFPDAVSERAIRHLEELSRLVAEGDRALLLFVVQRDDCRFVAPADSVHPAYRQALVSARLAGVEFLGAVFRPEMSGIVMVGECPVLF